jgi:hypothetical protein
MRPLTLSALQLNRANHATFGIGAAALGLLLVGIHNAWDSVTHMIVLRAAQEHAPAIDSPRNEPRTKDPSTS